MRTVVGAVCLLLACRSPEKTSSEPAATVTPVPSSSVALPAPSASAAVAVAIEVEASVAVAPDASRAREMERIQREAQQQQLAILAALTGDAGNLVGVLNASDIPVDLNDVVRQQPGVTNSSSDGLHLGQGGGGAITPGHRGGLSQIQGTPRDH
jgi:hypothetical protein